MQKHTRGSWAKKIVYYFGGVLLLVEVVVIVAVAILTAESNREILEKVIPARFLTPWLLLVYMLVGLILIKYGSGAAVTEIPSERVHPEETSPTLRERVRILSAQISKFESGRSNATPGPLSRSTLMIPTTPQEWNEATLKSMLYSNETHDIYLQRFAPQVTLILKELAKHGVVDAELNAAYLLNSDLLIGIREVAEHLNTLADRLPLSEATAPDVTLEGPSEGKFVLYATSHAREIRICPIIIEAAIVDTMWDGERTRNVTSKRYAIEFPVVGDLREGDKEIVEASLFVGEGYSERSAWPPEKRTGLTVFFQWAEQIRRVEIGEPDVNTCTDAEMNDFAERIRLPLTFSFDITFWDSEHRQQWKRGEQLVYEPMTDAAFVRPTGRPEPLVASVGDRS